MLLPESVHLSFPQIASKYPVSHKKNGETNLFIVFALRRPSPVPLNAIQFVQLTNQPFYQSQTHNTGDIHVPINRTIHFKTVYMVPITHCTHTHTHTRTHTQHPHNNTQHIERKSSL